VLAVDLARVVVGVGVLAFAAVCDLRWRRAPDACWLVVAGIGAALLAVQWARTPAFWAEYQPAIVAAGLVLALAVVGYVTGLITGGADAKALASLAVLAPVPLDAAWTLPLPSAFPVVLTSLTNGLLVALLVPVALVLVNLARGDVDGARTLTAVRTSVEDVDLRVVWPLEHVDEDGQVQVATTPGGVPRDAFDPAELAEAGRERIWVSPKVPFLVPLWVGLVGAVLVGDPLAAGLEVLLA
jgi:preflagellin peptidase FlaK